MQQRLGNEHRDLPLICMVPMACVERECVADGTGTPPGWFTYCPLWGVMLMAAMMS
jgi:hypothetical protein